MTPVTELKPAYDYKAEIKELFDEYTRMLVGLDAEFGRYLALQNYDAEPEHLEEKYGPPGGRLYLAFVDGRPAGCIGLRGRLPSIGDTDLQKPSLITTVRLTRRYL